MTRDKKFKFKIHIGKWHFAFYNVSRWTSYIKRSPAEKVRRLLDRIPKEEMDAIKEKLAEWNKMEE